MSERGTLFFFSIAVILSAVGAAVWLIASGQVRYVDGLFLLLTCMVIAAAFGLYLRSVIRSAIEANAAPSPAKASSTAQSRPAPGAAAKSSVSQRQEQGQAVGQG